MDGIKGGGDWTFSRSDCTRPATAYATLAIQSVECSIGDDEAVSSIPFFPFQPATTFVGDAA